MTVNHSPLAVRKNITTRNSSPERETKAAARKTEARYKADYDASVRRQPYFPQVDLVYVDKLPTPGRETDDNLFNKLGSETSGPYAIIEVQSYTFAIETEEIEKKAPACRLYLAKGGDKRSTEAQF